MAGYRLALANRSTSGLGSAIITDVLQEGFPDSAEWVGKWTKTLNSAGTFEIQLPIDAPNVTASNFAPGTKELHLYRNGGSGEVLVWAGRLWTVEVSAPWVRCLGIGWYEDLRHREVGDDRYEHAIEQQDAAWDLIEYTQTRPNGPLGITRANPIGTTKERVMEFCAEERTNVAEAIEDLAGADDGFDFEIDANKVFRTWAPSRGTDRHLTVTLDGATNIGDLQYTIDATQIENSIAGIGKVVECEPVYYNTVTDATSLASYGLMEGTVSRPDLHTDTNRIDGLARQRLAMFKEPRWQPSVELYPGLTAPSPLTGEFEVGDHVALTASWGFSSFTPRSVRVLSYDVTFNSVGDESVFLTLDGAVTT